MNIGVVRERVGWVDLNMGQVEVDATPTGCGRHLLSFPSKWIIPNFFSK